MRGRRVGRRMHRLREKHRGGRRWVGHPFPEEPDQTRWRDRIGLAGDRLGLGVDEAHVVEPRVHAADRIGDAAGEVDAFDDGPGRGMERRVEPWGEWSALFFVESGFSAALFVLKKSVFLSIAESLEPVADGCGSRNMISATSGRDRPWSSRRRA